jgi:Na+-translocating ferredoxin:NAD+ oxidoreductase RnfG subunit
MKKRTFLSRLLSALVVPRVLYAETFLTSDQAAAQLFPGQKLVPANITLTSDQKSAIAKASGVRVRSLEIKCWRVAGGGWLFVDNVVGKHEFIDFALALDAKGAVRGLEVLTYRETYGGEVRNPKWRAQFSGKSSASPLQVDQDIRNISGATLSCVHLSDGVKRLVHTWAVAIKV